MLRSMYSGISAMKNFQVKLDVIGNNIANVNTYGFKKGRTIFKDLVSQQIAGASGPTANRGGVNPKQVGLGMQLAAIDTVHTQGSTQPTGRPLDLAISGDGFFVLGEKNGSTPNPDDLTNLLYTRSGNFYLDAGDNPNNTTNLDNDFRYIVSADGRYLLGTNNERIGIPKSAQSVSIGSDGTVSYVDSTGALRSAGKIQLAKFANNEGLEKVGDNLFRPTASSGVAIIGDVGANGTGTIVSGALEMSNVDLAEEFTEMIVAQRGFQANTRIITTSDEILQELVNLKK
ncbi:flagellar basal body rod protein FlgG [Parageobacillus thermoglucosidasius]|uniref:Flagellar hook protein FlgE n=1 Tax=Parageobacillus thermoglucosidasius TaxID=1426 RepID=A0AB38R3U3_PARTM|nr:flagellar basal body rod protein FlgG [Parageobacillus thermoglucosidasius]MED4904366.1 flagellar basal body rod protein FlgG [Parageobacillus thermoglucosidasius]MED4912374.1 flagellar basal body rod protein FlgG [Parageobacillus thermoglucosidasius]MED4943486.1 flagellar basal body rod protein FlgG [Parageobacillus thermoglucosidasius]MED4983202.1 flagellar basal body rod protein FlgG [Parageobacillus thermoglucosidasius]UOE77417.1 flagellar basal body rod protein FlgG [Parageobacillus th